MIWNLANLLHVKSQDVDFSRSPCTLSEIMASGYMILSARNVNIFLGKELVNSRLLPSTCTCIDPLHTPSTYVLHEPTKVDKQHVFLMDLWIPASDKEGRFVFSKLGYVFQVELANCQGTVCIGVLYETMLLGTFMYTSLGSTLLLPKTLLLIKRPFCCLQF